MRPSDVVDMFRRKGGTRCVEVGRRIQGFLDGGLDADAAAKVAQHLDACRRCGLSADDYRRLKSALNEAAAPLPAEPLQRLRAFAGELAANGTRYE